jgi:hypothetical protein
MGSEDVLNLKKRTKKTFTPRSTCLTTTVRPNDGAALAAQSESDRANSL